jgi:hypothetical protein
MGRDAERKRPDEARKSRRFGPSKASVQAAPGQTEAKVIAVMRSLLDRPRATLRDAADLAGAPDDARVAVGVIPRHGRRAIEIHVESGAVRLQILLYQTFDGKRILENDQFDVVEGRRGRGSGRASSAARSSKPEGLAWPRSRDTLPVMNGSGTSATWSGRCWASTRSCRVICSIGSRDTSPERAS